MLQFPAKRSVFFFLAVCFSWKLSAQLSSFEVLGGLSGINNPTPSFKMNGTKELGLRYNQKIGWIWSGNLTAGFSHVNFNTVSSYQNDYNDLQNKYQFLQIGVNFNILTALRTLKGGDYRANKWTIKIACKSIKWYLCGGVEFLNLKESSDQLSRGLITNVYGGSGFEIVRIGKGAKQRYPALVPFIELKYFYNTSLGYYNEKYIDFDKITYSIGFKFTYGLKG
jgi:hypothetical protein